MRVNTHALLLGAAVLALSACAQKPDPAPATAEAANATPPVESQLAGGWSSGPVDGQIEAVAAFALKQMKRGGATISSIDSVQKQVVSGMNYRVDMTLSDKSRWRVQVYQQLDGAMELTAADPVQQ